MAQVIWFNKFKSLHMIHMSTALKGKTSSCNGTGHWIVNQSFDFWPLRSVLYMGLRSFHVFYHLFLLLYVKKNNSVA